MSPRLSRRPLHSGPSGNPDHHLGGRRAAVRVTMVMGGETIPPLHWWRHLPATAFTTAHLAVIRRAITGFGFIGEPHWPAAANGHPAAAIGIALRTLRSHTEHSPTFDLVMSALLRCALERNAAAVLVLAHVLDRVATDAPCSALATSWRSIETVRRFDRKLRSA
jgi:hypothetical protein